MMRALLSYLHRLIQPSEKGGDAGDHLAANMEIVFDEWGQMHLISSAVADRLRRQQAAREVA